jgi:hypothetical protein
MAAKSLTLTQIRISHGRWEAVLSGAVGKPPAIEAWHQQERLPDLTVTPIPGKDGTHAVILPIPASILHEGVQTVLLRAGDEVLAQFTLIAGVPLEEDLRAEINLLRAELDLLKRAFRRHCAEAAGKGPSS